MLKHNLRAEKSIHDAVPCRLRGLLYRDFDLLADPRHARGQAGRRWLRSAYA
jgi:hypothetical protein